MTQAHAERLTSRHRDCLRLVASNHSTKEIALLLNLSPNTVDGYISEAKEILGAPTRRYAARVFQSFDSSMHPQKLGGEFSRVALDAAPASSAESEPEEALRFAASQAVEARAVQGGADIVSGSFHWFRGGRQHNSLSTPQRLIWITGGSLIASIVFLVAVAIIETLTRLLFR